MLLRTAILLYAAMSFQASMETGLSAPASVNQSESAKPAATSGVAPFIFEGNRIYAELVIVRPDGTLHNVFAFVDLGSPSTIISPALFKELHLDQKKPLGFRVGEMDVSVDPSAVTSDSWLPYSIGNNHDVELVLPAGVMRKYQVVIDYAQRRLTFARTGTLHPQGVRVPFRLNEETGLVAVDSRINGQPYPITIDCGSAYTWLKKSVAQEWLAQHPNWERGTGAVGASNMRMADDGIEAGGTLLRIPAIELGSLHLRKIGALAIGPSNKDGDFIDWYSRKNPGPVIGWLGGNVLRGFRITIDYPNRESYWLSQTALDPHDLDQVGLTLALRNGEYFVAAITTQNGKPSVRGVHVGDKLLMVDALELSTSTWDGIFSAMHGAPGDIRTLHIERNGVPFTVQASIKAF
jgi:hypothetical protein